MNVGLFLGRFQPFHKGHLAAVQEAASQVDWLYVGIGSSNESGTERNPFSGEERAEMIRAATRDLPNLEIILVPDMPNRDDEWVQYMEDNYPKFDVIFTGNPYTRELFQAKGYRVEGVTMVLNISGTQIRELMRTGGDWEAKAPEGVVEVLYRIGVDGR